MSDFSRDSKPLPRAAACASDGASWPSFKQVSTLRHWLCFFAGCSLGVLLASFSRIPPGHASGKVLYGTYLRPSSPAETALPRPDDAAVDRQHLYIYEKNMKSGSTSWSEMLVAAAKGWDILPCWETNLLNALEANWYNLTDRDALMVCHIRRMSVSRERPARIISSFNLEKDMVISAFMEQKNLTIEQVDRNSTLFLDFREGFKKTWQMDYMGYTNFKDQDIEPHIVCPLTREMIHLIHIATADTYLPVSHDLPCMSRVLLRSMVGLEVGDTLFLNVRGKGKPSWDMELSCFDVEIAKAMTAKMAMLYDGTDLSGVYEWRQSAKEMEQRCIEDEAEKLEVASAR